MAETVGLEKSMLKKILHYSDIGVALLMVLVVVMMVIPLPTGLKLLQLPIDIPDPAHVAFDMLSHRFPL